MGENGTAKNDFLTAANCSTAERVGSSDASTLSAFFPRYTLPCCCPLPDTATTAPKGKSADFIRFKSLSNAATHINGSWETRAPSMRSTGSYSGSSCAKFTASEYLHICARIGTQLAGCWSHHTGVRTKRATAVNLHDLKITGANNGYFARLGATVKA